MPLGGPVHHVAPEMHLAPLPDDALKRPPASRHQTAVGVGDHELDAPVRPRRLRSANRSRQLCS